MRTAIAAVATALAITAPLAANADQIALTAPLASASIHEAGIDMNVYYVAMGEGLEVVATYALNAGPAKAARLQMLLTDGSALRFGLPGHPGTLYAFERNGETVGVSATRIAAPKS